MRFRCLKEEIDRAELIVRILQFFANVIVTEKLTAKNKNTSLGTYMSTKLEMALSERENRSHTIN
jgi:hypothetical protein